MITPGMTKRKRSEHYVNNKEFLAALVEYRGNVEISFIKKFGREPTKQDRASRWDTKPPIPRYIGECFLSGYSEVFDDNNTLDGSNYSDYNQIKDNVHSKLRS
mgnify:CR=1 FL=1